ncbi:HAD family hydrolase [Halomicrococcus gelatinilyticus]|uniref:HAD family hydrolase n=1 Tax=Halomicrococcus gelatinilyticus TaxID=1702103 RepID=UPI002E140238
MTASDGYEALLFDLDRTLVEHDQPPGAAFEAACAAVGREPFCDPATLERAAEVVRSGSTAIDAGAFERRVFETAAAAAGVDVDATALARAFRDALDHEAVSLRPGAWTALDAAAAYDCALVTNGPARTHETRLDAVGLGDWFETTVFGSDVPRVKPAREPFERALADLGVTPDRTLKIGDSLRTDVAGANDLGIDTVWVPYGDRRRTASDPEPTHILQSLAELPTVL